MFLYLFDTVNSPEKERQHLRVIQHYYFHRYLLTLIQVMISTTAAITHTALVGRTEATISPAENVIAPLQRLHRFMIITSLILYYAVGAKMLPLKFSAGFDTIGSVIA